MSVDYTIHIKRKSDNKEIGKFIGNTIKGILDSTYSSVIHCDGRNCNGEKFTTDDLKNLISAAWKDMESYHDKILEKKLMIPMAANKDIKYELEEDIRYLKEDYLDEIKTVVECGSELLGEITCVTEDMVNMNDESAYQYNGKDLPKKKAKYSNGEEYESSEHIWNSDIYCEIEASW